MAWQDVWLTNFMWLVFNTFPSCLLGQFFASCSKKLNSKQFDALFVYKEPVWWTARAYFRTVSNTYFNWHAWIRMDCIIFVIIFLHRQLCNNEIVWPFLYRRNLLNNSRLKLQIWKDLSHFCKVCGEFGQQPFFLL